jgi:hypothetical protein
VVRTVSAGSKVAVRGMVTVRLTFLWNPGKGLHKISDVLLCCCICGGLWGMEAGGTLAASGESVTDSPDAGYESGKDNWSFA